MTDQPAFPNDPVTATVAAAALLTGYSKSRIYKMITEHILDADLSTEGRVVRMKQLRRVQAGMIRGRPVGSSKHS
ncbi:hypothetical protein B7R22_17095 [Subtercola boreus]|uniref:Uncharacterized protein n=1 Tax=Subtercola boreus TaxID=120213 RepID=A0A3E0VQI6_9MICO|nr:hypothetical protein [Subtercola boreus]RFA12146.1 hypothetical protein B7R22_17095 [Subtercola boreus]